MKIIQWLISLFTKESKSMTEPVTTEQPAAVVNPAATANEAATEKSPLEQAKAKFDAFIEFVEHGIKVLGKDAEADLVALKDKFM